MGRAYPIDVSPSGAIILGPRVACDGFVSEASIRVQTHIHDDHMDEFDTSKGYQDIYMSEPTRMLLIVEFDADLPYRDNVRSLDLGIPHQIGPDELMLLSSGHMFGAVQVSLTLPDGTRLGYSGDFQWPMTEPIQVDALVLDSTYGSPRSIRGYRQEDADDALLNIVRSKLRQGPVHINAHRGTIQRALQVLAGQLNVPILGSARFCRETEVYRRFGCPIDPVVSTTSEEGRAAMEENRWVRVYSKGDRFPVDPPPGFTIVLSAYMTSPESPVLKYSERSCRVALSDHADFEGTVEYVLATGAQYVVTDNTRGRGVELALALHERLGVEARPSLSQPSYAWGV